MADDRGSRRAPQAARAQRHAGRALTAYTTLRHGPAPRGGARRARGAARRDPRQRALESARQPLPRDAGLHPLRRVPERLPGVPEDRRRRLRPCLLRSDGRGAAPAARRARARPRRSRTRRRSAAPAPTPARCKIPLHELLLELRRDLVEEGVASRASGSRSALWSLAWSSPLGYRATTRLARSGRAVSRVAGPRSGLAERRGTLPRLVRRYRDRR